jgi:outer membrane protein OmpA-like peptidoglycan-associated protein
MVSKKLKLLFTLCMFVSAVSFAQTGGSTGYMNGGYSIYDSSVIPTKRMGQQNEFWNNATSFPAKPRNMWEIGVSTGLFTVSGDVSSVPLTAPNFSLHVRKSFGYIFSLRLQYINTIGKGQNWKASENFVENEAWMNTGYYAPFRTNGGPIINVTNTPGVPITASRNNVIYYNYKTKVQDLSLQGIFTVNNIRFHKSKTAIIIYGGGGIGGTLYNTRVNALDANNKPYTALFASTQATFGNNDIYARRKEIRKVLKAGMDDTYETEAESHRNPNAGAQGVRPGTGKNTFKPSGTVLAGVAFKLSNRINLAIEDRWTFIKDDLLDGQRWQEQAYASPVQTRDFDSYNYASIGLNFNLGGKSTQPLYWLNPLDYAYSELNTPTHSRPKPQPCEDTDGDGVCDFLDREVTPAGCPVDTHGVTRDTDGDGVPDCKDKQLITPTECQPVDADGVGKCPVKCCDNPTTGTPVDGCPTDYPSLTFKGNACSLSSDNKSMLSAVASKMKANPSCNITVTGYPEASKAAQAVCNCRNEAIIKYLSETGGISKDRISVNCEVSEGSANKNTVDIK